MSKDAILEGIRLFIEYCGVDVSKLLPYTGWAGGESVAVASLAHTALEEYLMNGIPVFEPMQLLLNHNCDLEARNFHGNTVLLAAVSLVSSDELVPVATALVNAGANPLAISPRGWSVLHGLLWRLSACNQYDMTGDEAEGVSKLLELLLQRGCNPIQPDADGCSPSDLALSPVCWSLWCGALERAGFSVASIVREDSILKCGTHLEIDIQSRFLQIKDVAPQPTPLPRDNDQSGNNDENDVTQKCYRCHRTTDWEPRCPPFDVFGSYLMRLPGRPSIHRFSPDHNDGQPCLDALGTGPCEHVNHQDGPVREHSLGLSWRKQLAYELWRDGMLASPLQAYQWAKNVSRWALNPTARWPQVKLCVSKEVRRAACPMLSR